MVRPKAIHAVGDVTKGHRRRGNLSHLVLM